MDNSEFDRRALLGAAGLAGFAAITSAARAGDLSPPGAPVSGTMKTIDEAEPRRFIEQADIPLTITEPGSYYLRENLFAVGALTTNVITVLASNVTIDLRGFTIVGATEVTAAIHGVEIAQGVENVRIHAGNIIRCNQNGVYAVGAIASIIEDVCALHCGFDGLSVGDRAAVLRCMAQSCGQTGLRTGVNGMVIDCAAIGNGGSGVSPGENTLVRGCHANDNGTYGLALTSRCRAIGNTVLRNGLNAQVTFPGIIAFGGTVNGVIDGNFVAENKVGISSSGPGNTGWTIVRNIAKGNTGGNYLIGVSHHLGAVVADPSLAGPWDNLSN